MWLTGYGPIPIIKMAEIVGAHMVVVAVLMKRWQKIEMGEILALVSQYSGSIPPISAGAVLRELTTN